MKISGVELTTFVEQDHPATLLVLRSDSGLSGVGEIAASAGGHPSEWSSVFLADWLIGRDPFDVEALLAEAKSATDGTIRGAALVAAATAAMMDLAAQGLGTPVDQLLGGRVRDEVRACAVGWAGGAGSIEELAAAARRTVALGYTMLRVEPFAGQELQPATDEERAFELVGAVRAAVPDEVDLVVAGDRRLGTSVALELAGALRALEPIWFEDPVPPSPLDPFRYVSERVKLPLASGRGARPQVLRELVTGNLVDHLVLEVGRVGGLVEARRIAALAEVHHIGIVPIGSGSSVSLRGALQLAAVVTNLSAVEIRPGLAPIERGMTSVDHRPDVSPVPSVSGVSA